MKAFFSKTSQVSNKIPKIDFLYRKILEKEEKVEKLYFFSILYRFRFNFKRDAFYCILSLWDLTSAFNVLHSHSTSTHTLLDDAKEEEEEVVWKSTESNGVGSENLHEQLQYFVFHSTFHLFFFAFSACWYKIRWCNWERKSFISFSISCLPFSLSLFHICAKNFSFVFSS